MVRTDGGAAFPSTYQLDECEPVTVHGGMSLRDYFAAKALVLWATTENFAACVTAGKAHGLDTSEGIAKACYEIADSMLKERAK